MQIINISKDDTNTRLDKFLLKKYRNLNNILIFKYLKQNKIKVNNKKVDHNYLLQESDEIKIYFNENYKQIEIVYNDENLMVVNKPRNIECFSDNNNDNLINILKKQLNNSKLELVHRLDTNTNGLLIIAKNDESRDILFEMIKNNEIEKYYQTLVYGHLDKKEDTLIDFLTKDRRKGIVKITKNNKFNSKKIITNYKVLKEYKKYSLLEIKLITGKTHQIRAHLNFINHPIVGEKKYIKKNFDKDTRFKYQALTAWKIIFKINDKNNKLFYLNNKVIKLNEIDFLKKLDI